MPLFQGGFYSVGDNEYENPYATVGDDYKGAYVELARKAVEIGV